MSDDLDRLARHLDEAAQLVHRYHLKAEASVDDACFAWLRARCDAAQETTTWTSRDCAVATERRLLAAQAQASARLPSPHG